MKRAAIIFVCALEALLLCSCNPNRVDNAFLKNYDVHLKVNGNTILTYDHLAHQQGFNRGKAQFQVATDDFSKYYNVILSSVPGEAGQQVTADIYWTVTQNESESKENVTLEAVKLEGDKIWLWNRQEGIELLVQVLE